MEKRELIINTIVFKEDLDAGKPQLDLLERLHDLGFQRVEIRREFLREPVDELHALRERADALGLALFYSVSEDFATDGALHSDLDKFRDEALILGAPFVKLNVGDSKALSLSTLSPLKALLKEGPGLALENNQDPTKATVANACQMMSLIEEAQLPIPFVFDTGNWYWLGESTSQAAAKLAPVTNYLHCKNYGREAGDIVFTGLFDGEVDMVDLLSQFAHVSYLALEYPCSEEQLSKDVERLLALQA